MIPVSELPTMQPRFLPEPFRVHHHPRAKAFRSVIAQLCEVWNECIEDGFSVAFLQPLDRLISDLGVWATFDDSHIDEIILFAIEQKHLYLTTEIAEELCMDRVYLVEVIKGLEKRGLVYKVSRCVPGSGRPQHMLKSARVANVEAVSAFGDLMPVSIYQQAVHSDV